MLNCTDPECILHHHHVDSIQHHLQDDRQHHEHSSIMSGDANNNLFQGFVNNGTNQEYSSEHVDAPNEGVYMVCGVLIAMVLVAVIIVVLAVTISKLRKREETAAAAATAAASATTTTPTVVNNNTNNINNNNNVVDCQLPHAQPLEATIVTNVSSEVGETPVPLPFLWQYSAKNAAARNTNGYNSPHRMYNFDQDTMCTIPIEENGDHRKGLRKNLRGKWRRLVHKKQQQQDAYKIPAELRDQLKQIYVY